jgi:phage baseplate assembly protein W
MSIIKMPMSVSSSGKLAAVQDIEGIAKQKFVDYLSTSVFERPMLPLYGANTNVLLYENFDPLIFEEYKVEALQGMQRHISGVQVLNLVINGPSNALNDSTISMTVEYQIPTVGRQQATVTVVLPSDLTEDSNL